MNTKSWASTSSATFAALSFVTALLAVVLQACPPTPPQPSPVPPDADAAPVFPEAGPLPPPPTPEAAPLPPPAYDGSTTSACYKACQALLSVGCEEGSGTCVVRLQTISDGKLEPNKANRNLPLTCDDLAKVKTAADVVATGQPCSLTGGH